MIDIQNISSELGMPGGFERRLQEIEDFFRYLAEEIKKSQGRLLPLPVDQFPVVWLLNEEEFDRQFNLAGIDEDEEGDEDDGEDDEEPHIVPELADPPEEDTPDPEPPDYFQSDKRPTEYLGFYRRIRHGCDLDAEIVLCPERIFECAAESPPLFYALFSKVLIHELAHACMDYCHENQSFIGRWGHYRWVEESLANFFTLLITRHIAQSEFRFVRRFIHLQPRPYKFGGIVFDLLYQADLHANLMLMDAWRKGKRIHNPEELPEFSSLLRRGKLVTGTSHLSMLMLRWLKTHEAVKHGNQQTSRLIT